MDAGTLSALLIGAASLIGWMVTQTQARSRAQRTELRGRRKRALLAERYIFRLEHALSGSDQPLPDKPEGYEDESDDW
ncbi:MAG: hypothetical protein ACOH10_12855 [Rhodoglobus sp.]